MSGRHLLQTSVSWGHSRGKAAFLHSFLQPMAQQGSGHQPNMCSRALFIMARGGVQWTCSPAVTLPGSPGELRRSLASASPVGLGGRGSVLPTQTGAQCLLREQSGDRPCGSRTSLSLAFPIWTMELQTPPHSEGFSPTSSCPSALPSAGEPAVTPDQAPS